MLAVMSTGNAQTISQAPIFKTGTFQQTSSSAPSAANGFFWDARLFLNNPGDFDSVTLTYPGAGSPTTLALTNPTTFDKSSSFGTQAAMDAAFPFGTYTFTAMKSGTGATSTLSTSYSQDAYPLSIPSLTTTSWNALQGLRPSQAQSISFAPFTPSGSADESFVFFSIFDSGNNRVFGQDFLAASTTSVLLPANTLNFQSTYTFDLIYSDRIVPGLNPRHDLGFDYLTLGTFRTSAVPEPGAVAVMVVGVSTLSVATVCLRARRSGRSSRA
jgi:hypothetical protein